MRHCTISILLIILTFNLSAQNYIPGYRSSVSGEELNYHSPQPDAGVSLLVRSEDSTLFIEWESAPIPETRNPEPGTRNTEPGTRNPEPETLLLLAGIDVNPEDPHKWKVFVNNKHFFTISSPADTLGKTLTWPGPEGSSLVFKVKEVDKYGDFMGYLFCHLPASVVKPGEPVKFRVVG